VKFAVLLLRNRSIVHAARRSIYLVSYSLRSQNALSNAVVILLPYRCTMSPMPQSNAVMQCNGKKRKICSLKCHHTKIQQSKRQFQCIAEPKTDVDRSLSSSSKELPSSIVHRDPSLFVVYAMLCHAV
jgi:hypothetical protein